MLRPLYFILAILVAILGYHINADSHWAMRAFWTVCDFFLWPFAVAKWLIFQELTLEVIKQAFGWFFV